MKKTISIALIILIILNSLIPTVMATTNLKNVDSSDILTEEDKDINNNKKDTNNVNTKLEEQLDEEQNKEDTNNNIDENKEVKNEDKDNEEKDKNDNNELPDNEEKDENDNNELPDNEEKDENDNNELTDNEEKNEIENEGNKEEENDKLGENDANNIVDVEEKEIIQEIIPEENMPMNISRTGELSVIYRGHAEDISWQDWVSNGETAGNVGKGKRLEAIKIGLENAPANAKIMYRGHAEDISWQDWVSDGETAGIPYKGKRLEGIRIKLVNLDEYSVEYRAYVEGSGWQDWVCDGELAGSEYRGMKMEGLQIRIVLKSSKPMSIRYQGHAEDVSWQNWVSNGKTAGTEGRGKRLEAIKIKLENAPANAGIMYRGHAEDVSWQNWVSNGETAGITYKGKRLEGIRIKLINLDEYSVEYRAYVEGIGWQDWVCDGELAGSEYMGMKMEGLQIRLVLKANKPISIKYQAHLQNVSWRTETVRNGRTAGISGLNIEAIKISLENAPKGASIEYQAHSQYDSWLKKVNEGQVAGREYQGKNLEGIRIRLINLDNYSVQYRAYVKNEGWQSWVCDGELAGYEYQGKAIERLEIKLVNKIKNSIIAMEKPESSNISGKDKLVVSGWTLSSATGNTIKIYIDDKFMQSDIKRVQRDDISQRYIEKNDFSVVPDYGTYANNSNPGYIAEIDMSNISQGNHTLFVRLYNSVGTNIKTISKPIIVFKEAYMGIDVSHHNGYINWSSIKNAGVEFAMIRIGYRGYGTGRIVEDNQFKNNIIGATNNGIKVGIYFFSQAINEQEAREEAWWINNTLNNYGYRNLVSYPIVIDTEYTGSYDNNGNRDGRADYLNKAQRTAVCKAFLETVKYCGYTPMIYASKYWLRDNININELEGYDVWLAHYVTNGPFQEVTNYKGPYTIWQYTSSGNLPGISGNVDLNIGFIKYSN